MSDEEETIVPPEVEEQWEKDMQEHLRKHVYLSVDDVMQEYQSVVQTKNALRNNYVSNVRFEKYLDKLRKDKRNFEEKKIIGD